MYNVLMSDHSTDARTVESAKHLNEKNVRLVIILRYIHRMRFNGHPIPARLSSNICFVKEYLRINIARVFTGCMPFLSTQLIPALEKTKTTDPSYGKSSTDLDFSHQPPHV